MASPSNAVGRALGRVCWGLDRAGLPALVRAGMEELQLAVVQHLSPLQFEVHKLDADYM